MPERWIGRKKYSTDCASKVCDLKENQGTLYKKWREMEFFIVYNPINAESVQPVDLKTARGIIKNNHCSKYYKDMFGFDADEDPEEARRVQVPVSAKCWGRAKEMAIQDDLTTRGWIQKLIDDEYARRFPAKA